SSDLAQSEFDVARIVYGLLTTGVITLRRKERPSVDGPSPLGDPAAYVHEARRALQDGRLDAALESARQAVNADGQFAGGYAALGEALLRLGRVTEASDALESAVSADGLDASIHRLRGIAAAARGDFDVAVQAWGRSLELVP